MARGYMYELRGSNEAFAQAWGEATQEGVVNLEEEARRRAFKDVEEPLMYQGKKCGSITRYSDTLMICLLKAHKPEKYRERQELKHAGDMKDVRPVLNLILNRSSTDDDE